MPNIEFPPSSVPVGPMEHEILIAQMDGPDGRVALLRFDTHFGSQHYFLGLDRGIMLRDGLTKIFFGIEVAKALPPGASSPLPRR